MENNFAALKSPDARIAEPVKVQASAPIVTPVPAETPAGANGHQPVNPTPETNTQNTATVTGSEEPAPAAPMAPVEGVASTAATTGSPSSQIIDIAGDVSNEILSQREREITRERAARDTTAELFRDLGVESLDQLRERLAPPKELSPEERKRQDDLHKMSVQDFGVKELGYAPEDFSRASNAAAMTDEQLVFDEFKSRWIHQNKDNQNFSGKDLDQEARYEFDQLFHLASEDERIKTLGRQSLEENAKQLREQRDSIYKNTEKEYQQFKQLQNQVKGFQTIVNSVMKTIPTELKYDIDGQNQAVFQLDKINKAELNKYLVTDPNFDVFVKKGGPEATAFLEKKTRQFINEFYHDEIVRTVTKTALDVGVKKATAGAKSPFGMPVPQAPSAPQNSVSRDDDAKIGSLLSRGHI